MPIKIILLINSLEILKTMDNRFIIDNLLMQNKSEQLEFIVNFDEDTIAKNITAMLNESGGTILVGINEKRNIVGVDNNVNVKEIQSSLLNKIRPFAPIDIQSIEYKSQRIILINIWEGAQKPYLYDGIIYQKTKTERVIANSESINKMLKDREQSDYNWEKTPIIGAEIEDLDLTEVRKTMEIYESFKGKKLQDEEEFLMNEGLLINGYLTKACILLYANNPLRFLPQATIRLSVYTSDSTADLIDAHVFDGNIFRNVDSIFQFIDMTYSKTIKVDGVYRTEKWNYPRIAVREGIMNAIIHRDYNNINSFMNILIFPKRMEITCYGNPLVNLNENTFSAGYSILRNPNIAHHCYYRQLIEMMGTGIPRMIQDSKINGFDVPKFIVNNNIVKVVFPNIINVREENNNSQNLNQYFEGIIEGTTKGIRNDVKRRLVSILCLLHCKPGLRTNVIGEETNIPVKSIERYMNQLKNMGILFYSGGKNTGGYYLSDHILKNF